MTTQEFSVSWTRQRAFVVRTGQAELQGVFIQLVTRPSLGYLAFGNAE
jgi:hypothetical protein